jgi:hypothetical protein
VKAVHVVYEAKRDHDRAVLEKRNIALSTAILSEARKTEREAVAMLEAHRNEHKG